MATPQQYETARNIMEKTMGQVRSADAAYEYLRDTGLDLPRSVVRTVWRETGEQLHYRPAINQLPEGYHIPRAWMSNRETMADARYGYRVSIVGKATETGGKYERHPTIYSDTPLTLGALQGLAADVAAEYDFDTEVQEPDIVIEWAWHNEALDW
jgi:hypothetical protein